MQSTPTIVRKDVIEPACEKQSRHPTVCVMGTRHHTREAAWWGTWSVWLAVYILWPVTVTFCDVACQLGPPSGSEGEGSDTQHL